MHLCSPRTTLRLLPVASLLLCGSLLMPPALAAPDTKPAAGKKAGKKKGKKKAKKSKADASTPQSSKQLGAVPATPEETMHAMDEVMSEVKCIEDSALRPEEKKAAYDKLLPRAIAVGKAAHQAGGFEVIQQMLGDYGMKIREELRAEMEKKKLSRQDIDTNPELMPEGMKNYWAKWTATCERYKVNPNRLMPGGLPSDAGAIALALRGASEADLAPATNATAEEIRQALQDYGKTFGKILAGTGEPEAKGNALLKLNNSISKYVLAMQANKELYAAAGNISPRELNKLDPQAMEASDYEGSLALKSAVRTTVYLWRDIIPALHRTQPPLRW